MLIALKIIIGIATGAALAVIPVVLYKRSEVIVEISAEAGHAMDAGYFWVVPTVIALGVVALALAFLFVDQLLRIVSTVGQGDPFAPINALRLKRMAWLSVGLAAAEIPINLIGSFLSEPGGDGDFDINVSALLLALVLFILARVFRRGAEMREELEGTV